MTDDRALDIVCDLNSDIYDLFGMSDYYFEYGTTGNEEYITFSGITLWSSENDEREYDASKDDKEDLRLFLLKRLLKISTDINKIILAPKH